MLSAVVLAVIANPSIPALGEQLPPIVARSGTFIYSTSPDARSWTNLLAKTRLDLGPGHEVELETGDRPEAPNRVKLKFTSAYGSAGTYYISLRSDDGSLTATVTLVADPRWPILHKFVAVNNTGKATVRLLNVVLGRFPVGKAKTEGGDRGFPLYLNQQFFVSLTHPAGFSHVEGKDVVLRQYPGVKLVRGQPFQCMEAIYGVAKTGQARKLFVDYVRSRMARVVYHHDKPYAILEAFGGQQEGDFKDYYARGISEEFVHKHLQEVAQSKRDNGVQFDFYSLEFWHDRAGNFTGFNKQNFPKGFDRVKGQILGLDMKPGLWIASSGTPDWTIDQNPAVKDCFNFSPGVGAFCRASEPLNQIYKDGFRYQMRENKVGLLKFDNLEQNCVNPAHNHLPGPLYSTEAIYNSVIDFFQTLREANRDVFIMLYWGYRSPWWLQYGDTYFECGDQIEAASPAQYPTPYARDSVTQRLDQAQLKITDTPWLGKDSLGVWLSNWTWNSGIGKARWQEGTIMDMARGGLLFQMWTDADWLTPPERTQVATFIKLFKTNADCFDNSRFILGDPNRAEPYGYSCCNGKKAFLAINNACLKDSIVHLNLGPGYGLPRNRKWDVYRWYPNPARLRRPTAQDLSIAMRPYEVALLEVVPASAKPSLARRFVNERIGALFSEATRGLPLAVKVKPVDPVKAGSWTVLVPIDTLTHKKTKLTILPDSSIRVRGANEPGEGYVVGAKANGRVTGILLEALTADSLPAHGPGRAVNGNFALTSVRVFAMPAVDGVLQIREAKIRSAKADFSQTSFGGWPISATLDDDLKTGWSIHPQVGIPHAAVFEFAEPIDNPRGTILAIGLAQGENGHSLGRFRLSYTHDPIPALPAQYQPGQVTVRTELPATKTGGLLMIEGGSQEDAPQAFIDGKPVDLTSVWAAKSNWSCPWTAWRAEVGPSQKSRHVEIRLSRKVTQAGTAFKATFIPGP